MYIYVGFIVFNVNLNNTKFLIFFLNSIDAIYFKHYVCCIIIDCLIYFRYYLTKNVINKITALN